MVAVGDPLQSLYGFSGADPWSFQRIKDLVEATDLPLSVCYRCGREIVDLASKIVPQIEPFDKAPEGSVKRIWKSELGDTVEPGDMVICRTNTPVVQACLDLVKKNIPAYVRGADLKGRFLDIVDIVMSKDGISWQQFESELLVRKALRVQKLTDEEDFRGAAAASDLYDAVDSCYEILQPPKEAFQEGIATLFAPKKRSVVCSSIHRAKGLESNRVFLVRPDIVRLRWKGQLPWQAYQEQCCEYVAITRAMRELYLVEDPTKDRYEVGGRMEIPEKPSVSA
jgi:DNA helicase-2/ATP-dependent DNA helicase PcrA